MPYHNLAKVVLCVVILQFFLIKHMMSIPTGQWQGYRGAVQKKLTFLADMSAKAFSPQNLTNKMGKY